MPDRKSNNSYTQLQVDLIFTCMTSVTSTNLLEGSLTKDTRTWDALAKNHGWRVS
jgi:hypothetical protein